MWWKVIRSCNIPPSVIIKYFVLTVPGRWALLLLNKDFPSCDGSLCYSNNVWNWKYFRTTRATVSKIILLNSQAHFIMYFHSQCFLNVSIDCTFVCFLLLYKYFAWESIVKHHRLSCKRVVHF